MKYLEKTDNALNVEVDTRSIISFLGIEKRESVLIKIVLSASQRLAENFKCLDDLDLSEVDILFIDSESRPHIEIYLKRFAQIRCVPVLVHSGQVKQVIVRHPEFSGCLHISRPIKKRDLKTVLQSAIRISHHGCPTGFEQKMNAERERVLVVDHSARTRVKLFDALVSSTYYLDQQVEPKIEFAASGAEAVDKFKMERGNYNYVLLEEDLKEYDSYRICQWMKTVSKRARVIILTKSPASVDMLKAASNGCDNYLVKPISNTHVDKVLRLTAQNAPVPVTQLAEQPD